MAKLPSGGKNQWKNDSCESKVACKSSKKESQKALNHVLIGKKDSWRRAVVIPLKNIDLGAFCVELRPFYCNKRISVPMSYISWLDINTLVKGSNKKYAFNVPLSVLVLGGRTNKYDLSCPRAKCQKQLWARDKKTCRATQKKKHGRGRPGVLFLTSR